MTEQPRDLELAAAVAMPAPQGGALPTGLEWQALERMATFLADSDLVPFRLKRKPADVAVILLAAREYGIPPLMALSKLPVVNGTPAPMGELMVALVLRAGHSIRADFKNPDGTRYKGGPLSPQHYGEAVVRRRDWTAGAEESLTFTLEEAVTAGLIDRITPEGQVRARVTKTKNGQQVEEVTPWEQYTPNMARWRAVANVCRLYFPDVLLGLSYLPEELGATVDADGRPIEGEVVEEPRRRATPQGSQEEREAQATADRLAEFTGPLEVLDKVREHADANGYLRARVIFRGNTMTLDGALAVARADLANTVPADVVEDHQAPAPAQERPQEPRTPEPATEEAPAPENAPQEPAQQPEQQPTDPAVLEYARAALEEASTDTLRDLWNMAKDTGTLDANVIAVVGDDDLAALDLTTHEGVTAGVLPLRGLLLTVNAYVAKHGTAVRDLGAPDTPPPATTGADPWAADAAAGWQQQDTPPGEYQ